MSRQLDPVAIAAANKALYANHPELHGRSLTSRPKDAALRNEWLTVFYKAVKLPKPIAPSSVPTSATLVPTPVNNSTQSCIFSPTAPVPSIHDNLIAVLNNIFDQKFPEKVDSLYGYLKFILQLKGIDDIPASAIQGEFVEYYKQSAKMHNIKVFSADFLSNCLIEFIIIALKNKTSMSDDELGIWRSLLLTVKNLVEFNLEGEIQDQGVLIISDYIGFLQSGTANQASIINSGVIAGQLMNSIATSKSVEKKSRLTDALYQLISSLGAVKPPSGFNFGAVNIKTESDIVKAMVLIKQKQISGDMSYVDDIRSLEKFINYSDLGDFPFLFRYGGFANDAALSMGLSGWSY